MHLTINYSYVIACSIKHSTKQNEKKINMRNISDNGRRSGLLQKF